LDLLVVRGRHRLGVEVKRTTTPSITPSMRNAIADLKLTRLFVVHAGDGSYQLSGEIRAVALQDLLADIRLADSAPGRPKRRPTAGRQRRS
jgi:hypothetical protein